MCFQPHLYLELILLHDLSHQIPFLCWPPPLACALSKTYKLAVSLTAAVHSALYFWQCYFYWDYCLQLFFLYNVNSWSFFSSLVFSSCKTTNTTLSSISEVPCSYALLPENQQGQVPSDFLLLPMFSNTVFVTFVKELCFCSLFKCWFYSLFCLFCSFLSLCSWLHWRAQVLLSFSITSSHVHPYFYALISFPNTFTLLKPDSFVPLSCSHLQAHDVLSMEKRLGSSHWKRWMVLQEGCLSCSQQLLLPRSWTGLSLWYRALQCLITLTFSGINSSGRLAFYSRKTEEENTKWFKKSSR